MKIIFLLFTAFMTVLANATSRQSKAIRAAERFHLRLKLEEAQPLQEPQLGVLKAFSYRGYPVIVRYTTDIADMIKSLEKERSRLLTKLSVLNSRGLRLAAAAREQFNAGAKTRPQNEGQDFFVHADDKTAVALRDASSDAMGARLYLAEALEDIEEALMAAKMLSNAGADRAAMTQVFEESHLAHDELAKLIQRPGVRFYQVSDFQGSIIDNAAKLSTAYDPGRLVAQRTDALRRTFKGDEKEAGRLFVALGGEKLAAQSKTVQQIAEAFDGPCALAMIAHVRDRAN